MGTTPQADVPGNVYFHTQQYASLASNGTDRAVPFFPPGGQKIQVLSAWIVPLTSQAGSATNYPGVRLVDYGTGSAGTTVLASKEFSATSLSVDANTPGAMTLGATVTVSGTHHIVVTHEQVANGLDLVAHAVHMAYRYL